MQAAIFLLVVAVVCLSSMNNAFPQDQSNTAVQTDSRLKEFCKDYLDEFARKLSNSAALSDSADERASEATSGLSNRGPQRLEYLRKKIPTLIGEIVNSANPAR